MKLRTKKLLLGGIGIFAILLISVIYMAGTKPAAESEPADSGSVTADRSYTLESSVGSSYQFAAYKETPVNFTPNIPKYTVESDLSNISNISNFEITGEAINLLAKNSFVTEPSDYDNEYSYNEFFQIYENNGYSYCPSFITVDSLLHNYHLMYDYLLKNLEEEKLAEEIRVLNQNMLAESLAQYEVLKGGEWENAAKRNVAFFAVGWKLLDPNAAVPSIVSKEVDLELELIDAHEEIAISPVMNMGSEVNPIENLKEDYSQYIPRGHYEKSEELKAYFKAMMWYGRMSFRLKSEDEVKSAVLITLALNKKENRSSYDKITAPIEFLVGRSDDITYLDLTNLLIKTYGKESGLKLIADNAGKFSSFVAGARNLTPPAINSIPIFNSDIQPDRENEIKAFRFMGQKFTVDAFIFQQLVDRTVPDRMLPNGLDIPAAMGSDEALKILNSSGAAQYENYSENMAKLRDYTSRLGTEKWTQNLYWGWLYQLQPLLKEKGEGYPPFMQNTAWVRKDLNTYLSSFAELKHDTILYSKQVYAEMGDGPIEELDDRGYVEPEPVVYARLASLTDLTIAGLESQGLLSNKNKTSLEQLKALSLSLKTISEKELENKSLTNDEYELIRSYGGQLEHFWLEVNQDEPAFKASTSAQDYLDENPSALISDVATDPNGQVLEMGTGRINKIYVVVPINGELRLACGGVYSYFEFPQAISNRLTDTEWRNMLSSRTNPDPPSWIYDYLDTATDSSIHFNPVYAE